MWFVSCASCFNTQSLIYLCSITSSQRRVPYFTSEYICNLNHYLKHTTSQPLVLYPPNTFFALASQFLSGMLSFSPHPSIVLELPLIFPILNPLCGQSFIPLEISQMNLFLELQLHSLTFKLSLLLKGLSKLTPRSFLSLMHPALHGQLTFEPMLISQGFCNQLTTLGS